MYFFHFGEKNLGRAAFVTQKRIIFTFFRHEKCLKMTLFIWNFSPESKKWLFGHFLDEHTFWKHTFVNVCSKKVCAKCRVSTFSCWWKMRPRTFWRPSLFQCCIYATRQKVMDWLARVHLSAKPKVHIFVDRKMCTQNNFYFCKNYFLKHILRKIFFVGKIFYKSWSRW